MVQYISLVYSKVDRPDKPEKWKHVVNSSNRVIAPKSEDIPSGEGFYTVKIKLNDTHLTNMFVDQVNKSIQGHNDHIICHHNEYYQLTPERMIILQDQMNSLVAEVNSTGDEGYPEFPIDTGFILEHSETDCQVDKLNALHEWFEDVEKSDEFHQLDYQRKHRLSNICEQVNQLVHTMETLPTALRDLERGRLYFNQVCRISDNYTQLRSSGREIPARYELTPEDYSEFEVEVPGRAYLDFATVGKSMWHAFFTNDIELIKNQKVSPQKWARPFFNYKISNDKVNQESEYQSRLRRFDKWIEENNLQEYIDRTEPQHAMGQACIGDVLYNDEPIYGHERHDEITKEMTSKLNSYTYLYGVYFT